MLHVVRQIQRRFPGREDSVVRLLTLASASGLLLGLSLLLAA
ncbi:MAG: hypothetical protein AAF809_09860 [Bacteroidota bacterium]